jgi:hypothetical protein
MPTPAKTATDGQPAAPDLQGVLAALEKVADALATNTAELQTVQHNGSTNTTRDDRRASVEQGRTVLNYQVISQMLGRATEADLTVLVQRVRAQDGRDTVHIFNTPAEADKAAVLAAGDPRPELLALTGQGGEKTVILDRTAEKDIDRLELLDNTGSPIRLGPRLPRLPADGSSPDATRS